MNIALSEQGCSDLPKHLWGPGNSPPKRFIHPTGRGQKQKSFIYFLMWSQELFPCFINMCVCFQCPCSKISQPLCEKRGKHNKGNPCKLCGSRIWGPQPRSTHPCVASKLPQRSKFHSISWFILLKSHKGRAWCPSLHAWLSMTSLILNMEETLHKWP